MRGISDRASWGIKLARLSIALNYHRGLDPFNVRAMVPYLQGRNRHDVVDRRNKAVHAPVAVDFRQSLFQEIRVCRVHRWLHVSSDKLASFRWILRYSSTSKRGDDGTNVQGVIELRSVSLPAQLRDKNSLQRWRYCRCSEVGQ